MEPLDRARFSRELEFLHNDMLWRPTMNQHPLVRADFHLPERVIVCDETLREGEETPGVCLTMNDRLRIARKLEEVGIPEIEVGYVGAIPEHAAFSRELKRQGIRCKLVSHTRTYTKAEEWKSEIDRAVEAGSDVLCLLSHGSETLMAAMPWLPIEAIPERVAEAIKYAHALGVLPALALTDGIRTPLDNFLNIHAVAAKAGVKRVYVMDGQGVGLPDTMYFLVQMLRGIVGNDVQIAMHCHDDYGMATANTLAGVKAGAQVVDTVIGGFGDKSGIGATEEVVMGLEVLYGVPTGVKIESLYDLTQTITQALNVRVAANKSIVGDNNVRHQIDSHINTLLRGIWWAWESIRPDLFGRQRSLEWAYGKLRTGRSGSLAAKLDAMGLSVTDAQWEELISRLSQEVATRKMLREPEVETLILEVIRGNRTSA